VSRAVDRFLGPVAVGLVVVTVWLGLWVTPPDEVQGDLVRLLYLHPAVAWVALYLAFGFAALASALYLWPRTRDAKWDLLAASTVEVGVVFLSLTLATGMLWGRPAWGVWWTWDARLTSTALLEILFIGYLALRRVPADPHTRARRCAVLALLASLDVPIVHFSVQWWNGLHQGATVLDSGFHFHVHGSMLWTLLLSFVAFSCVFAWMVRRRYQIAVRDAEVEDTELAEALLERRAEGVR
jgi:heme exporter protein C